MQLRAVERVEDADGEVGGREHEARVVRVPGDCVHTQARRLLVSVVSADERALTERVALHRARVHVRASEAESAEAQLRRGRRRRARRGARAPVALVHVEHKRRCL